MTSRSRPGRLKTTTFRAALLLGGSLAACFIAAACGETGEAELPSSVFLDGSSEDGRSSSVSPPNAQVDAAAPDDAAPMRDAASDVMDAEVLTAPRVTMLRPGVSHLHGVTTGPNPHAVYSVPSGNDWQVEAVPIHGGPASVIGPGYGATLRGGAVGLFRTTAAGTTLTLWTAANGSKPIPTSTTPLIFDATEDGSRAVMSVGFLDAEGKTDVAITSTATPSTAPTFSGVRTALGASYFKFHGARLVTWHDNLEGGVRRIVTVDPGGTPVIHRQDVGAAPDGRLVLADVDRAGTTALISEGSSYWFLPLGGNGFARPFPAGSLPQTSAYRSGFTMDGTKYVFTGADGRLYVSTVSAVPTRTDLGIANVFQVWIAPNSKFALVRGRPPGQWDSMTTIDLSKPVPTPITWLTDQVAFDARFLGTGARVVFVDFTPYNEMTMSAASGGGDQRILLSADAGLYAVAPVGSGVLFTRQLANAPPWTRELLYVDGVVGGAGTPITGVVDPTTQYWSNKSLVLTAAAGLFAVEVP